MSDRKTIYAKVIKDGDEHLMSVIEWRPWIRVRPEDVDQLPAMVAHRWVRDRGGVAPGEEFGITVYTFDDSQPLGEDGEPLECQAVFFEVAHDPERWRWN